MDDIIKVWYLSNNEAGQKLFSQIKNWGIQAVYLDISKRSKITPSQDNINVFVFDLVDLKTDFIVKTVTRDERFENSLKLCILTKKQIQEFYSKSYNSLKLELLQRPIDPETFLLLLEKSLLVELYRELFYSNLSSDVLTTNSSKIHFFESVMEINRKQAFKANSEKLGFDSIIKFQNNFQEEQTKLKKKIKKMHFDSSSFLTHKD